jgi:hypothetical protein
MFETRVGQLYMEWKMREPNFLGLVTVDCDTLKVIVHTNIAER